MKTMTMAGIAFLFSVSATAAVKPAPSVKPASSIQNITVAVIDTGTDIHHKNLKDFIWVNEGETGKDRLGRDKETNGVDDDDNGFVDDVHGWNFVKNNNDVSDSEGHGTHISGVIKREFEKHRPHSTSAPSVRLMIVKYYDATAKDEDNVVNTVKAIRYATRMRARIINYSGGGDNRYPLEFQALKEAERRGILIVAAAGNNRTDTDRRGFYPANYPLDNIISVAASDASGDLMGFSNYGAGTIDLAAPGELIYSTLPGNRWGVMSGTSQATAHVTGLAASLLLRSRAPATRSVLRDLLALGTVKKSLKGKTKFQTAMLMD